MKRTLNTTINRSKNEKNDEHYTQLSDIENEVLARPVTRNGDTFAYNPRGEVESAMIDGNSETHGYDFIGNSLFATFNGTTNTYTANSLNQITSLLRASAPPREISYDADGNMTNDGVFTYTYDSASRLTSVSSNGLVLVTNQYDHKGRRVRKAAPTSETIFLYDDWNLIYEREIAGTVTNETYYYWGKDISGSLHGSGGIGGLLYLKRNGMIYVPNADAYGNIVRYTDTAGNVVAGYTYDAFGGTLSQSGSLSTFFRHRFSTKYLDVETGLYYYGYRFYSPLLMRWLTRDPLEEKGGINLYAFCGNNSVCNHDKDGCAYFIKRSMFGLMYQTAQRDIDNQEWAHEQLIFEDGKSPKDVGYFGDSTVKEDPGWEKSRTWVRVPGHYNDCVMRKALESVQPRKYKMRGEGHYNCQDYADDLRARYGVLIRDKRVRCECGLSK